jgi:hypothetical protein
MKCCHFSTRFCHFIANLHSPTSSTNTAHISILGIIIYFLPLKIVFLVLELYVNGITEAFFFRAFSQPHVEKITVILHIISFLLLQSISS